VLYLICFTWYLRIKYDDNDKDESRLYLPSAQRTEWVSSLENIHDIFYN